MHIFDRICTRCEVAVRATGEELSHFCPRYATRDQFRHILGDSLVAVIMVERAGMNDVADFGAASPVQWNADFDIRVSVRSSLPLPGKVVTLGSLVSPSPFPCSL